MSVYAGRLAKVVLGTYTVAEMASWAIGGAVTEMLDSTSFGDKFREFEIGLSDGGTVTIRGHYDISDTNGQAMLYSAWRNQSALTAIKFYVNSVSYYTPDVTGISASRCLVQSFSPIEFDQAGIGTVEFALKVSGALLYV